MHACGLATDLVIDKCLARHASMVISPCCYGTVQAEKSDIRLPRSKGFGAVLSKRVSCNRKQCNLIIVKYFTKILSENVGHTAYYIAFQIQDGDLLICVYV